MLTKSPPICYIPGVTLSIPDFSSTRVVVAGDVMLDQYLFGTTGRISPEAPVPVVHIGKTDDRPGGAANVAVNLAALGVGTRLLGVVGDDGPADILEKVLAGRGIDCGFHRVSDRPTITKTRVQSRGQQLIRLDQENTVPLTDGRLAEGLAASLDGAGAVILEATDGEDGLHSINVGSDGRLAGALTVEGAGSSWMDVPTPVRVIMDGREVFRNAVIGMGEAAQRAVEAAGWEVDDVDLLIPHQANLRIIDATAKRLGLDEDQVYTNIQYYGNTSAASIPKRSWATSVRPDPNSPAQPSTSPASIRSSTPRICSVRAFCTIWASSCSSPGPEDSLAVIMKSLGPMIKA